MKLEIEVPDHLESEIRELVEKRINKRSPGRPPLTTEAKIFRDRVKKLRNYYYTLKTFVDQETYDKKYAAQEIELFIAGQQGNEETIARYERERPWEK